MYAVTLKDVRKIHFNGGRYAHCVIHNNPVKRHKYRKIAANIKSNHGKLTCKSSPNFWSYHLPWYKICLYAAKQLTEQFRKQQCCMYTLTE